MSRTENRTSPEHAAVVIKRLGGTGAAASLCRIDPASVSGWKKKGISELRTELLKAIRPDVFVDLDQAAAEQQAAEQQAAEQQAAEQQAAA
jgi:hypothetical protein